MLLYRFITLDAFIAILTDRQMYLRQVTTWEDPYETDAVSNLMRFLVGKTYLAENDRSQSASAAVNQLRDTLREAIFGNATKIIYAQSWTEIPESDALWRIYSPDKKGLRLSVERDFLAEAISKSLPNVEHFEVEYCSQKAARSRLMKRFNVSKSIGLNSCRYKRPEFKHEKEYRFCASQNPRGFQPLTPDAAQLYNEAYLRGTIETLRQYYYDPVKYYEFNPQDIEEVTLDPRLEPGSWYEKAIRGLCAQYGISKVNRSKLYS